MANIQRLPPGLALGHCAICGDSFRYSVTLTRPPRTCGMDRCMVKAGEEETVR